MDWALGDDPPVGHVTIPMPMFDSPPGHGVVGTIGSLTPSNARPVFGVKLTGYRILNILVVLSIGTVKFVLSWQGASTAPTAMDWALGVGLWIGMYWLGFYEDAAGWKWFFHEDWPYRMGHAIQEWSIKHHNTTSDIVSSNPITSFTMRNLSVLPQYSDGHDAAHLAAHPPPPHGRRQSFLIRTNAPRMDFSAPEQEQTLIHCMRLDPRVTDLVQSAGIQPPEYNVAYDPAKVMPIGETLSHAYQARLEKYVQLEDFPFGGF